MSKHEVAQNQAVNCPVRANFKKGIEVVVMNMHLALLSARGWQVLNFFGTAAVPKFSGRVSAVAFQSVDEGMLPFL